MRALTIRHGVQKANPLCPSSVQATIAAQAEHIRQRISQLQTDPAYFKKVYRYTFVAGKEAEQRALALDNAIEFWRALFMLPGQVWTTNNFDFLQLWTAFLKEKWTRTVSRDMWYQTLEFKAKTLEDETLSFWTEDSAWPSVVDDFVAWFRAGPGAAVAPRAPVEMDTDRK
jgi:DCN1-like protein 1/2